MKFGEKVRRRLAEMKRTQVDLAEAAGTTQQQVSSWLNQGVNPSSPLAIQVAKYLGLSLDYLLDDAIDEPPDDEELSPEVQLLVDLANDIGPLEVLSRAWRPTASRAVSPGVATAVRALLEAHSREQDGRFAELLDLRHQIQQASLKARAARLRADQAEASLIAARSECESAEKLMDLLRRRMEDIEREIKWADVIPWSSANPAWPALLGLPAPVDDSPPPAAPPKPPPCRQRPK